MSYQVINPFIQFVDPINGKPLSGGSVYFGRQDSDPKNQPANRINVYAVQDNGTEVLLAQPITLNGAGQPQYSGSVKQIKVELYTGESAYAIQVFSSSGSQKGYSARVYSVLSSDDGVSIAALANPESTVSIAGVAANELAKDYKTRKVFAPLLASNTAAQNSAILQAKIDYANSLLDAGFYGGISIDLPQGQFNFAGVEIKRGLYGISGAGMTQTVLNLVGSNVTGFYCRASTSGLAADQVDFGFFSGFTIQPKTPNITAPVNQVMWDAIGFSRWRVEDVYFGWCGGAVGIRATNGAPAGSGGPANWHNTFINCYVNRAASWPAGGIGWLLGDTSLSKEQITTWAILGGRTSGSGGGTGLNIQSCNTVSFYGHAIEGCSIEIGNHGGARIAENVCFIPAYFEGSNTCTIGTKASNTNFIGEFITGYTVNDTSGTLNRISPTNFQTRCGNSGTEDWIVNIVSAINRRPKFKGTAVSGVDLISNSGTVTLSNTWNVGANYDKASFYSGGTFGTKLVSFGDLGMEMLVDGAGNVGSAANRCNTVYAVTGAINTSDEREKTELLTISEAERLAAIEIRGAIRKFKFKDAVSAKGEKARIHFGVGAQTVKSIMEKHGLNAFDYGLLCYDEWEQSNRVVVDDSGNDVEVSSPAGNRYGIRYDELAMFILAAV